MTESTLTPRGRLGRAIAPVIAIAALVFAMGGTWRARWATAAPDPPPPRPAPPQPAPPRDAAPAPPPPPPRSPGHGALTGKLNLNTATAAQLELLPSVGPAKAERILSWRKRHGGFKRIADLRRVKGFGYRTFKRLAPYLDVQGETTLARR